MCDDIDALVLDVGSGVCKFGFAGDDEPRVRFSPVVGRSRFPAITREKEPKAVYVGNETEKKRGILKLKYAIERGIVTDWDDMETILNYGFHQLDVHSSERPILLTEPLLNPKIQREKFAEMLFENFNVPAIRFHNQTVLTHLSCGRHASIVLECGHDLTQIAAIEGLYVIPSSITRSNMAGSHLTNYLSKLLTERGHGINSSAEREIVRDIKEKHCYVAQDYDKEQTLNVSENPTYELPDGQNIFLSNERFHCPEALFKPSLLGLATPGVHQMLFNSITKCDTDLRLHYYCNVMLSGGTSQLPGFRQRVENEIRSMVPSNVRVRTYQLGADSVWIGGSMAASLSTFRQTCISVKEYEESGAVLVHRDSL